MGSFIGFTVGYVLGSKAGREALDELRTAWTTVRESEETRELVRTGLAMAAGAVAELGQTAGRLLGHWGAEAARNRVRQRMGTLEESLSPGTEAASRR